MKFSDYFYHTQQRIDRKGINMKWIEDTFNFPDSEIVQQDGRLRRWKFISEMGKYLRIVVLEDKETVHNAFLIERLN